MANKIKVMTITEAVKLVKAKPSATEVKEIRKKNPAFAAAVDAVAAKFGAADKAARNRAGFPGITDEEWKLLPYAEREYKDGLFPYICGHQTHPMTSVLQREEADAYYSRQRDNAGTGTGGNRKGSLTPEQEAVIAEVKSLLPAGKWELIAPLFPRAKSGLLLKLTGYDNAADIPGGSLSITRLMFRNGENLPESGMDVATAMAAGFLPAYTSEQVKGMIAKLKEKGIDLHGKLAPDAEKALA